MSCPKLSLVPATDKAAWDAMVARSPQGTLFSETAFLDALQRPYHLWWVIQGNQTIKAGVCLTVTDDGRHAEMDDLVIYGGILFDLDKNRSLVKRRHDEFQIAEFVAEQFPEQYESLAFPLSPQFGDMRPFLWYRYHEPVNQKYFLNLRYTSYLDISSLTEDTSSGEKSNLFKYMETLRRRHLRDAQRELGYAIRTANSNFLLNYYRQLMSRQDEDVLVEKLAAMERVMSVLCEKEQGGVFQVYDREGIALYAVMYGWDNKRAYYLYGAGHPDVSTPWQGTLAHWEAFRYLAGEAGITCVDLEGVNSPQRGWFKLSFGGDIRPYYEVYKHAE